MRIGIEDFIQYTWELKRPEPDKDESLMPALVDVSAVLHLSTIKDWQTIADWYSDISNNKAEEDIELVTLPQKLFPHGGKPLTQTEKAKHI